MLTVLLSAALAQTVGTVPVQGTLTDAAGVPLQGSRTVTFRLFDAASGGDEVYDDTLTVAFVGGAFSAWLGSGLVPLHVEAFAEDLWLEVELPGAGPAPRVSVGWAPRAGVAASALTFGGMTWDAFTLPWSKVSGSPLPAGCTSGQVPAWNGSAWACAPRDALTAGTAISLAGGAVSVDLNSFWNLSRLSCADGQVPRWNATSAAWTCADSLTPSAVAAAVAAASLPKVQLGAASSPTNGDCGTTYAVGTVLYTASQGFLGCTASGWQAFGAVKGSEFNPGTSCKDIRTQTGTVTSGTYWVQTGGLAKQQVYCDMTTDGGGWTLVASNVASDTLIPGGTGRNNANYTLAAATRGTPSPTADYIIGPIVDSLTFTEARINGDRATNTERIDFKFPCTSRSCTTNSNASGVITDLNNANITFYTYLQWTPTLTCTLDAVARDAGFDANSAQSTVGGACVQPASGDPSGGCYVGHGTSEGSFEGWYDDYPSGSFVNHDADKYATWVR